MDLTKALAELKRTREYLEAVSVSEQTLILFGSIGDEMVSLTRKRDLVAAEVARMSEEYTLKSKAHNAAMSAIASERISAQEGLESVKREIALAQKAFGAETKDHADQVRDAKKEYAMAIAAMNKEAEVAEARLKGLQETIQGYLRR